jgi:hypothetical protein
MKTPEQLEKLARDWLKKHDPGQQQLLKSPRLRKWQCRKKARMQERMQERGAMAQPLLKGV